MSLCSELFIRDIFNVQSPTTLSFFHFCLSTFCLPGEISHNLSLMAAISITSATVPCYSPSKLCAASSSSSSLQFRPQSRPAVPEIQRILSLPQRRILTPVEATKQSFSSFSDLLENSDKPVLVDFYATWCGPCQFMAPVLDQVSVSLKDRIQVVKVDTEKYPKIADQYQIQALPTFIIFKDGKPCDRFEGALTADQLTERIATALKAEQ